MAEVQSRVRFTDQEPHSSTPSRKSQETDRPNLRISSARTALAEEIQSVGETIAKLPSTPISKTAPANVTAADKGKLSLWELAELGLQKEIAWKVERTLDIDVNQRDKFGRTALMWAAEQGHVAAIETLLDLGSDRTIRDPHTNRSALHLAARGGQAGALKALLEDLDEEERVAFLNDPDKNGITPVFLAKQKGEDGQEAFEFLMQNGARYTQQAVRELPSLPAAMPEPKTPQAKFSSLTHVFSNANTLDLSASQGKHVWIEEEGGAQHALRHTKPRQAIPKQ